LRRLTSLFLDRKEFTAVPPVRLTNDVVVAVAAQACLPVLHLGLQRYDGFVGIVLHPTRWWPAASTGRRRRGARVRRTAQRRGHARWAGDAVVARRAQQQAARRPRATTW
jgi:Mlc titration factor MtfA (ptsG expression regulator)